MLSRTISNKQTKIKLFIGGLPSYILGNQLQAILNKIVPINNIKIVKNQATHKSKGFAFFTISTQAHATKIVDRDIIIGGRILQCQLKNFSQQEKAKSLKKRVFVGGLPTKLKDTEIARTFSIFGEVRAAYSIRDTQEVSKGFSFVDFKNEGSWTKATSSGFIEIDGKTVQIKAFGNKNCIMKNSIATFSDRTILVNKNKAGMRKFKSSRKISKNNHSKIRLKDCSFAEESNIAKKCSIWKKIVKKSS